MTTNSSRRDILLILAILSFLALLIPVDCAWAAAPDSRILNRVVEEFRKGASAWGDIILGYARLLFFGIAIIHIIKI